jgi:hypothetical protein
VPTYYQERTDLPSGFGLLLILVGVFLIAGNWGRYGAALGYCDSFIFPRYCGPFYFLSGCVLAVLGAMLIFGGKLVSMLGKLVGS